MGRNCVRVVHLQCVRSYAVYATPDEVALAEYSNMPSDVVRRWPRCSISSVQFSKGIFIAQLSRMSHCTPAARKTVRFKFTPQTRIGDVLVV